MEDGAGKPREFIPAGPDHLCRKAILVIDAPNTAPRPSLRLNAIQPWIWPPPTRIGMTASVPPRHRPPNAQSKARPKIAPTLRGGCPVIAATLRRSISTGTSALIKDTAAHCGMKSSANPSGAPQFSARPGRPKAAMKKAKLKRVLIAALIAMLRRMSAFRASGTTRTHKHCDFRAEPTVGGADMHGHRVMILSGGIVA